MTLKLKGLKKDELLSLELREVFESYGFIHYKMSKFEDYAFYMDNKNFLKTEQIIAFSDKTGKLLALKPDITLSIAKNSQATADINEKLYYNESVYRYAKHNKEYKEVQQMGLEVMGNIDDYQTLEIITLSLKSLENISKDFVLDLSHMGLIAGLFELLNITSDTAKDKLLDCLISKNTHDLIKIASSYGVNNEGLKYLQGVLSCPTNLKDAIAFWSGMAKNNTLKDAIDDLSRLYNNLKESKYIANIRLDISIVNDTSYYNNIIFQGYIKNIPFVVLSGGRYDLLMQKFGRDINAMGFALTLDELSRYFPLKKDKNTAVAVVYNDKTDVKTLTKVIELEQEKGFMVTAFTNKPSVDNYGKIIDLTDGKTEGLYV